MAKTRAIRFTDQEEKLIQEFLKKNQLFDFSMLARTAIIKFIENPALTLTGVRTDKKSSKRKDAHVSV